MVNLILCGGSGTRLWPISRQLMPKQFVKFFTSPEGKLSLFQQTVLRNNDICSSTYIVSNEQLYFLAMDQVDELAVNRSHKYKYLLEPIAKNTAPAITLACLSLEADDIVLVTPSDHLVNNQEAYKHCIDKAKMYAKEGFLVTFGIVPDYAHTGYGYIQAEDENVIGFFEKPDKNTAKSYINSKNFYWNSGMFCFTVQTFLDEIKLYAPKIYDTCKKAYENIQKNESNFLRIEQEFMALIPEDSIDYAVMEKSKKVKVVNADIQWSDLGSFESLHAHLPKDDSNNTLCSEFISINSHNNFVHSAQRVIAAIDVDNLIIVDSGDALLIAKQGSGQKVKEIVAQVRENTQLHNIHLQAHRPWGSYTILEDTPGYKIKRIEVKPGKRLSLQKHFHRNEHWIVVSGTAEVTVGENSYLVRPNESTYIKMGEVHRLSNPGKVPVVLIEAQVGEYTEEDDIIRIEDDFNRNY